MKRALLVFGKEPRAGAVKTRLIPAIGPKAAADVYHALLQQALQAGAEASADSRTLYLDIKTAVSKMTRHAMQLGYSIDYQVGDDLGARMARAIEQHQGVAQSVVLIGSDCPDYSAPYIDAAFDALANVDAVLGPASDGGYVLIGLRRFDPVLFDSIHWSSQAVLAQTRARLRQLQWGWQELDTLDDVDSPRDLARHHTLAEIANLENSPTSDGAPPVNSAAPLNK